jgi:dihydroorotate dehydrogenase electron transfer subunit
MAGINRNAAQLLATIVGNKKVGQYHQILISVGELVSQCKPGNFVAISVGGPNSKMVLRRAFAISRTTTSPQFGGAIELIVAPHGNGSSWLCGLWPKQNAAERASFTTLEGMSGPPMQNRSYLTIPQA